MSELRTALNEYLAVRRALGFKLEAAGGYLQRFVEFAEREGAETVTADVALRWATQCADVRPAHWSLRLGMVRRFAQYLRALDPRTEVPPADLLPFRAERAIPYFYSDQEIQRLLDAARQLPSATGLRAHSYATLVALYVVTGMRTREALQLDRDDVDLAAGLLTVRDTKFGKSRCLPIHPSTQQALRDYAERRDRLCPHSQAPSFFVAERGTRLTVSTVRWTFVKLSRQIGLRGPDDSHGPRLHDFRHRFAVNTLVQWYRDGQDVERRLPELAAFLGHARIADTYWYLTAVPELMGLAALRLEQDQGGRLP
jgi:integrase/recombinase XerD